MLSLNFLVLPLTHPLSRDSKGSQAGIELKFSERYMVSEQLALDQFLLKNMNVCQNDFTWLHFFPFFF